MKCPHCDEEKTKVVRTTVRSDLGSGGAILRVRFCERCEHRFLTAEVSEEEDAAPIYEEVDRLSDSFCRRRDQVGDVYILENLDSGLIKVGFSTKLESRIR